MSLIGEFASAGTAALNSTINNVVGSLYGSNQESKATQGARNYDWWKALWQRFWQTSDFNKQNEEYWKRWNADNEYNDPSNVARRLSAAGFNPAQAMSSAPLASASGSSPSMPSAMPMNAVPGTDHSASINQLGSGLRQSMADVANLINAFAQADKTGAEAARIRGLTPHETEFARYHSQEQKHKAEQEGYESWLAGESLFDKREMVDLAKQSLGLQLDETKAQIENLKAEKVLRDLSVELNKHADAREAERLKSDIMESNARISRIQSEIRHLREDTRLTKEERNNRIAERLKLCRDIANSNIERYMIRLGVPKQEVDSQRYRDIRDRIRGSWFGQFYDTVLPYASDVIFHGLK